jgi:signal transduction histidine kinase
MLVIDLRTRTVLGISWILFAGVNCYLTFALAGQETIPYHLVWASFALLYGLCPWPATLTRIVFVLITVVTGIALVGHAAAGTIGWEECSEVVLMALILWILVWHVDRQWAARRQLIAVQSDERERAEKRELAARFGSHEVRTRLTIARGYANLIADQSTDPDVRADADLVVAELVKASALATNVLTLVRVDQPAPRSRVNIDELVRVVVRRWSVTAVREWSGHCDAGVIDGDAERFEATLDCLLENAVKFTIDHDDIAVTATRDGTDLVLSVRDSGAGIPATDLDSIFDAFRTGRNAGERAGSGLGLAIVRAITEALRGTVHVQTAPGAGTTFTLRYPISANSAVSTNRGLHPVTHDSPAPSLSSATGAAPGGPS